ncbi:MAG: hypothetical protein PVF35_08425, partial [Gammaproteobacteria bacterium]
MKNEEDEDMFIQLVKQFLNNTVVITSGAATLLVLGLVEVQAAKPIPDPLTCTISPADGATAVGQAIRF